jgi:hypothetical protein
MIFIGQWCDRCERDRAVREREDFDNGCKILPATMVYEEDDPRYPKAWVYKDGKPICTEFREEVEAKPEPTNHVHPKQGELI